MGRLQVADQLLVAVAAGSSARKASARARVSSVSATTSGRAASPAASTPTTLASSRPVPIRSVSTSTWALGGAPGVGGRPALPDPPREPGRDRPDHEGCRTSRSGWPGSGRRPCPPAAAGGGPAPSSSVSATKVGHIQAPRRRQRMRAGQKRSFGSTGRRVAFEPWPSSGSRSSGRCPTGRRARCRRRCARGARPASCPTCCSCSSTRPCTRAGRRTEPGDLPMGEDWYRAQGIEVEDDRPRRARDLPRARAAGGLPDHGRGAGGRLRAHDGAGDGRRAGRRGHRRRGRATRRSRASGRASARSARSACTCRAA